MQKYIATTIALAALVMPVSAIAGPVHSVRPDKETLRVIKENGGKVGLERNLALIANANKTTLWMPAKRYHAFKLLGIKIPKTIKPFTGKAPGIIYDGEIEKD